MTTLTKNEILERLITLGIKKPGELVDYLREYTEYSDVQYAEAAESDDSQNK